MLNKNIGYRQPALLETMPYGQLPFSPKGLQAVCDLDERMASDYLDNASILSNLIHSHFHSGAPAPCAEVSGNSDI